MVIVFHVLTMDIWSGIVKLLTGTTIKDHRIQMNDSVIDTYLMVIAFYVLTMDIWLGIVKFLAGTTIICKTLEASLELIEIDIRWHLLWMTLNALNVIIMDTARECRYHPDMECYKCHNYGHNS